MRLNWNSNTAGFVKERLAELLAAPSTDSLVDEGDIARKMQALPVYTDLGGALAFTPDGHVLCLDWQTEQVRATTDDSWMITAAVAASEKYPELRELLPRKPPTAAICQSCLGTGKVTLTPKSAFRCGTCSGLGWVESV